MRRCPPGCSLNLRFRENLIGCFCPLETLVPTSATDILTQGPTPANLRKSAGLSPCQNRPVVTLLMCALLRHISGTMPQHVAG